MEVKSMVFLIKHIFQDSVIRIPYFCSSNKSSLSIAIPFEGKGEEEEDTVMEIIREEPSVVRYQFKLYYEKEDAYKTAIVQFESENNAEIFYMKYSSNCDASLCKINLGAEGKDSQWQQAEKERKMEMYFCKDITPNGINMEGIIYKMGKVSVQTPESAFMKNLIKSVARLVVMEGIRGEQELINYKDILPVETLDFMDPKFMSSEAIYYRWRVYSYAQGDGDKNYKMEPFQMMSQGPFYHPPSEHNDKYGYRILSSQERKYFSKLLDSITPKKYYIEEAMSFCINNLSSSVEICCIISISIVEVCKQFDEEGKQTVCIRTLTALFYLITDILFNSPNMIYRDIFTVLLPLLIEKIPHNQELNSKIKEIVDVWNKKFIFEEEFLQGLLLLVKRELPSMKPHGMEEMTRTEHECYKDLLNIENQDEIEEMCWKYGLVFNSDKMSECFRNLAAVLALNKKNLHFDMEPEPGPYDGELLSEKDLAKIKSKSCKIISCEDVPLKSLLEREKNSRSISYDLND